MTIAEQRDADAYAVEFAEPQPIAAVMAEVLARYDLPETTHATARVGVYRRGQPVAELAVA